VAEVAPELAVHNQKGEIENVRYQAIYAMMLNEFIKEHSTVEQLKATVAKQEATIAKQQKEFHAAIVQQRKDFEAVVAQLKDQAAQIQKVSAQLEVNKFATGRIRGGGPAPQAVANR
jgi:septal ring factor EnvC (AmiA/AmiB activator)